MALLFLLDRSLPPLGERAAGPDVDRTTIRIRSARALPEKIIFDTSTEMAATPLLAADSPDHGESNASVRLEMRKPDVTPASRRRAARAADLHSNRNARAASSRLSTPLVTVGAF
ncbi:hypothetical protein [Bradyrhizobium glycinis]|uniref:hypothetical protein n=1 Tax=Bradyrhizobium glycinis TaxID=2751812 RepID=UPI0018D83D9E|nr:hypothetical protein [Bradyrhizobium glycinis]MBH5371922.1 hypothetical protein [Bradyrhizobium glycinis]